MADYTDIARHFESDFAEATMTVRREDGLYRHIDFSAPKTMNHLTVITWPYNLLVAGSHGSYHFERYGNDTEDMLDWLRGMRVNPDGWASKLVNGRDSVSEYDRSQMLARINERVAEAIEDDWAPEGLCAAVDEEILGSHLLDAKDTAFQLVSEFQHGRQHRAECSCGASGDDGTYDAAVLWQTRKHKKHGAEHQVDIQETNAGFDFDDFTEWDVDKLSYHFVYQCHAAVWAIGQYDAARQAVAS